MEHSAREEAGKWGSGLLTNIGTQRFQGWAILDLADAIRESGDKVARALDNIEAGIIHLTEAVQNLD